MDKIWKSKFISLQTKLGVMETCVFSSMLCSCETQTNKGLQKEDTGIQEKML